MFTSLKKATPVFVVLLASLAASVQARSKSEVHFYNGNGCNGAVSKPDNIDGEGKCTEVSSKRESLKVAKNPSGEDAEGCLYLYYTDECDVNKDGKRAKSVIAVPIAISGVNDKCYSYLDAVNVPEDFAITAPSAYWLSEGGCFEKYHVVNVTHYTLAGK